MLMKCPRCKDRAVGETELAPLTWKRTCAACGFVFVIKAVETNWEPPSPEDGLQLSFA